ncbi:MAG: hypothetical protein CVU39_09585 [Chloroflexi bacterium HGW-Chloroflexi-10]|nr:MAG: hypothetical protein CVU39_09585 [Chloroflexi bacterium HGW-Chloroflexi-10]
MAKDNENLTLPDENEDLEEEKSKKNKIKKEQPRLPIMLELVYSFSLVFTILSGLVVAVVSFSAGCTWIDIFLRTVVSILSVGLLMWLFSVIISNGALRTMKVLHEEAELELLGKVNGKSMDAAFAQNGKEA